MRSEELRRYDQAAEQPIEVGDRVMVKGFPTYGRVSYVLDNYLFIEMVNSLVYVHNSKVTRLPSGGQDGTDQSE